MAGFLVTERCSNGPPNQLGPRSAGLPLGAIEKIELNRPSLEWAAMILTDLTIDRAEFGRRTGWELKAEGACKGEFCVPLPGDAATTERIDARVLAEHLRMPLVHDSEHGLWALGPASLTGRALVSAEAPDLVLPDLNGTPFALSSLLGTKVVLAAWASW